MGKTERAALDSTKRYVGIILSINVSRNFGFICPNWTAEGDDDNIFFHFNGSSDLEKSPYLQVGTKVIFSVREDDHGVPMAFKVKAYDESVVITEERPDMPDSKTIKLMRQEARRNKKAARKAARLAIRQAQQVVAEQHSGVEEVKETVPTTIIVEAIPPLNTIVPSDPIEEIEEGSDDELDVDYNLDYEEHYDSHKVPKRLRKPKEKFYKKRDSYKD